MVLTVLLGGARSGKSDLAVTLARRHGDQVTVVATAQGLDDEMVARIARHRADRPAGWITVEEPLDVVGALDGIDPERTVIVDCLTLWVANAEAEGWEPERTTATASQLGAALARRPGVAFVVTNEVGAGIVPGDAATRRFRDLHGRVNRAVCEHADEAVLVVAGRVLPLVPPSQHWRYDRG